MDRNNPVWREYLKAVIRIQIDAGVDGVQLDEAELPLTTLQYGGCFCKDCLKGFRAYLSALPARTSLPSCGGRLTAFHYGEWLLARGYDFKSDRGGDAALWPLSPLPARGHHPLLRRAGRLRPRLRGEPGATGARLRQLLQLSTSTTRWPKVDLIITEMRNTRYRQPAWYRYVAGSPAGRRQRVSWRTRTAGSSRRWWRI